MAAASAGVEHADLRLPQLTPWKASCAMRSETVKPIPAIVPPPATDAQPTGGRRRPRLARVASHAEPAIPTGLPST